MIQSSHLPFQCCSCTLFLLSLFFSESRHSPSNWLWRIGKLFLDAEAEENISPNHLHAQHLHANFNKHSFFHFFCELCYTTVWGTEPVLCLKGHMPATVSLHRRVKGNKAWGAGCVRGGLGCWQERCCGGLWWWGGGNSWETRKGMLYPCHYPRGSPTCPLLKIWSGAASCFPHFLMV